MMTTCEPEGHGPIAAVALRGPRASPRRTVLGVEIEAPHPVTIVEAVGEGAFRFEDLNVHRRATPPEREGVADLDVLELRAMPTRAEAEHRIAKGN